MIDGRRTNSGYVINASIPVGDKEFVLGEHQTAPGQFVTWECKNGTNYIWGHYTDSPLEALRDLCRRVMEEVEYLEIRERAAAKGDGRQKKPTGKEER